MGPSFISEIEVPVGPRYVSRTSEFGMELGAKFHQRNRSSSGSPICQWNFEIRNGTWGQVPPAKSEFHLVIDIRQGKFGSRNGTWGQVPSAKSSSSGSPICQWNFGIRNGTWAPSSTSEIGVPVGPRYANGTSKFEIEIGAKFHPPRLPPSGSLPSGVSGRCSARGSGG